MTEISPIQKLNEFSKYEIPKSRMTVGLQNQYKFPNNYGASLIYTPGSYDLELAVLNFSTNPEGELEYNTPITNDVLGFLTWEKAVEALTKIKELPSNKMEDE
ncbi:hypothetical protein [Pediococcus acidilactici]|uniref:hypothetical protein n=1 Tax=Pediococcus acidilactici TaxID=1254 RepID=UPI0037C76009